MGTRCLIGCSTRIVLIGLAVLFGLVNALHTRKGYVRSEDHCGPKMNVHSPYLVITSNSSFSLTCEGHQFIRWNTTLNMELDERAVIHQRAITKGFKSTIAVQSMQYSDTGAFTCYYDTNDTADLRAATVYVYVTDTSHLFVPVGFYGEDLIIQAIQEGQEGLIPCKPTHPAINVTLFKFPEQQVLEQPGDVEFDPTRGFILKYPNIFFNGLFECKAVLGEMSQIMNLHLLWLSNNGKPPRPRFEDHNTKISLDKRELNLSCITNVDTVQPVEITWEYPNPKSSHIQVLEREEQRIESFNGYQFLSVGSTLIANHLEVADGGRYACVIKDAENRTEAAEIYVPIENPAQITATNLGDTALSVELGDEMKLRCEANGYPKPQLRWYKDGTALDPLRTRRYDIVDLQTKLIIEEVVLSDSGVYACSASNRGGSQTRTVTVLVLEPGAMQTPNESTTTFVSTPTFATARRLDHSCWILVIMLLVLLFNR